MLAKLVAEDRRVNSDMFSTRTLLATYRIGRFVTRRSAAAGKIGRLWWRIVLEPFHRVHVLPMTLVGCEIPYAAAIGRRFRPVHGFNGIFISVWAEIGNDVVMLHQVTIGSNQHTSANPGAPKIGDRVFIGAGAKVIGAITIGNDARIGANAIVVTDVPSWATAVSPKAVVRTGKARDANLQMPAALNDGGKV